MDLQGCCYQNVLGESGEGGDVVFGAEGNRRTLGESFMEIIRHCLGWQPDNGSGWVN